MTATCEGLQVQEQHFPNPFEESFRQRMQRRMLQIAERAQEITSSESKSARWLPAEELRELALRNALGLAFAREAALL